MASESSLVDQKKKLGFILEYLVNWLRFGSHMNNFSINLPEISRGGVAKILGGGG